MSAMLQTRPAPTGSARRDPAIGMWVVLVGQLMLVLDATIVNVALPHIATDLHFGSASLSWVLNAYSLAFGGLLLLGGRLGDVLGRRRVFMTGLGLFTLASFAGGFAHAPWELVTSRALQGVGAALSAPSVLALIATNAPNEVARNRALAAFAVISSGGAALGLMLGGTLTDLVSWRWTMFVNVPIGLAVLFLVPGLVNETARRHGRFDFVGAGSATAAAVSIVWTVINAPEHGWGSARTIAGFVLGAALLVVLAVTERQHPHPLLRPALLRSRQRIAGLVAMAAVYGGMLATFFLTVQLLSHQFGYSPLRSGVAFLPVRSTGRVHHVAPGTPPGRADRTGPADRRRYRERVHRDGPATRCRRLHQLRRRRLPVTTADGLGHGRELHADNGPRPQRRRTGAHRIGLRPAADHAAARRSGRARGGRLRLRRTERSWLRPSATGRVRRGDSAGRSRTGQRAHPARTPKLRHLGLARQIHQQIHRQIDVVRRSRP
jgi:MFS family permease